VTAKWLFSQAGVPGDRFSSLGWKKKPPSRDLATLQVLENSSNFPVRPGAPMLEPRLESVPSERLVVVSVRIGNQVHIDFARNIGLPVPGYARRANQSKEDNRQHRRHHPRLQCAPLPA